MLIKVCGLFDSKNISDILAADADMLGFIFYKKSPRNALSADSNLISKIENRKKVAVFVNETIDNILNICNGFNIKTVQLHGSENKSFCKELSKNNFKIIKAFSISNKKDLENINNYQSYCDFALLDTRCNSFGGSGTKFDWRFLDFYNAEIPFILSGGISTDDAENILKIQNEKFAGIDINSRFENANHIKDITKIKNFIKKIKG